MWVSQKISRKVFNLYFIVLYILLIVDAITCGLVDKVCWK
jgi:hypothetical protein